MSFSTSATLTLKNDDDFHRVLEFVKPDESDTEPQTDEEYRQVIDFLHNLQKSELCAWMTKHCTRLYVNFRATPEEKVLSWSGRNIQGGLACDIRTCGSTIPRHCFPYLHCSRWRRRSGVWHI
jgi:hypothetical protein